MKQSRGTPARPGPRRTEITPAVVLRRYIALFRSSGRWLMLVLVLFVASMVGGVVASWLNPVVHEDFLTRVGESLAPALAALREGQAPQAILLIFWRNVTITLLILGAGALVFLLPLGLLIVGTNAYLLGVILALSDQPLGRLALAIVPHAIFELPALVIAAAWSVKMGITWMLPEAAGRRGDVWRATVQEGLWIAPLLILLLAIAAVVEVLVSGRLSGAIGG